MLQPGFLYAMPWSSYLDIGALPMLFLTLCTIVMLVSFLKLSSLPPYFTRSLES